MKPKEFSKIPDNFFEHMLSLKVLHLVNIDLRELLTSLSCLVNLQTLRLYHYELGDTTLIGNLRKLEILSFCGSDIEKLPEEMCQLTRLRLLDLTDYSKLSVISSNVMSNLIKLEALYMVNTSIQWERGNVGIDELKHLCYLTLLEIHIPDPKMAKGLLSQKLERYEIFIGHEWKGQHWKGHSQTYKMLKLSLDTNEDGIISQLK
ncbi:hypothetical protein Dsin_015655 [Dipteronia sinensis]|uniref:Uncharacterized protein n=1 Tax=Dipteronia sinensis TaxID=43782 RepID=A0AAE0E4W4_9ROSI|nr:hypothetical protein Dsin_015655 [Dipteronia sinensis]